MPLLQQTEDWQTLTSLILQQAPQLAQQGRLQTLAEWLQSLPDSVCEEEPWILYWLGVCGLPFSPSSARGHLEKAYNIFKAKGDPTGQMLAWCTIVETFTYEFADVAPLDHWIAELERFMEKNPFSHRLKLRRVLLLECSQRLSSASLSTRCSLNGRSG